MEIIGIIIGVGLCFIFYPLYKDKENRRRIRRSSEAYHDRHDI
jgi:uncharacterized membrane protein YccC